MTSTYRTALCVESQLSLDDLVTASDESISRALDAVEPTLPDTAGIIERVRQASASTDPTLWLDVEALFGERMLLWGDFTQKVGLQAGARIAVAVSAGIGACDALDDVDATVMAFDASCGPDSSLAASYAAYSLALDAVRRKGRLQ